MPSVSSAAILDEIVECVADVVAAQNAMIQRDDAVAALEMLRLRREHRVVHERAVREDDCGTRALIDVA
jgi:hypothetical protein